MAPKKKKIRAAAGPDPARRRRGSYYSLILLGLIVLYAVLFSGVAVLKYRSFSFHDIDLAIINQTFWSSSRGIFTTDSPGESTLLNGGHVFLIILPLIPLYALFPSPVTLLVLQSAALGIGAGALYLLARDLVPRSVAFTLAAVYLVYPALNFVNLYEFHVIALATPLLLFMFYYYHRKRWNLYLLFLVLSLACREDVAIPVFAIGVFALIKSFRSRRTGNRGDWKWAFVPLLAGTGWFLICIKVIQPLFRPEAIAGAEVTGGSLGFYGWLGGSLPEIIATIFLRPGMVIRGVLSAPKSLYLLHLLAPVSFLPLLSPAGLIAVLISLLEGLLSERFTHFSIRYQYSSIITPLIFIAAAHGLRNLLRWRWLSGKKRWWLLLLLAGPALSVWFFGPLPDLPGGIKLWKMTPEDRVRQSLVEEIPQAVPVIATFEFTPKLSLRPELYYFYHVYAASRHPGFGRNVAAAQENCLYALIDFNDYLTFYDFFTPGGDRDVSRFLIDGNWRLVDTINSLCLYRKGTSPDPGVIRAVDPDQIPGRLGREVVSGLRFEGYRLERGGDQDHPVVEAVLDFSCAGKIPADFLPAVRLTSESGDRYSFGREFFAPYRIYPTSRWRRGEYWRLFCRILIPPEAPAGPYGLEVGLLWPEGRGFTGRYIYRAPAAVVLSGS